MKTRHPGSMWFPADMDLSRQYARQVNWVQLRADLEARRELTTIGWTWIQRRGTKKWTPGRLKAALGDDIEIYRLPSLATRHDITPKELAAWEAPVEPNLSQLNLTRADLGEKPLWDVWVRLTPPEDTSLTQRVRGNQHIKNKNAQDTFTENHNAEVERRSHLHPLQIEIEEHQKSPRWMQERAKRNWLNWQRNRTVRFRLNHRLFAEKPEDRLARLRREAYDRQMEKIEAGRQRVAHMALKRKVGA